MKFLHFFCKALPNLALSHPSGLITGHSPWSLWPLKTVLQFLNGPLSCFWAFVYAASSIWNPLFFWFLYLGKLLISLRSRSHASPTVKPSLHVYDTFLWNFSSQVWLSVPFSLLLHSACPDAKISCYSSLFPQHIPGIW